MTAVFAHSNLLVKGRVCLVQLDPATARWHSANMKFRIRDLRKERDWTIDQLADLTALSRGYLSQLETGKRQPSVETLETLAQALKVAVPDLYADRDLGEHLKIMRGLSEADQASVIRHALVLSMKVDGSI